MFQGRFHRDRIAFFVKSAGSAVCLRRFPNQTRTRLIRNRNAALSQKTAVVSNAAQDNPGYFRRHPKPHREAVPKACSGGHIQPHGADSILVVNVALVEPGHDAVHAQYLTAVGMAGELQIRPRFRIARRS